MALDPLFQQRDRIALVAHVRVRVVGLLNRDDRSRRRHHFAWGIRRDEFKEAARERLVIPQVVSVTGHMHRQYHRQARRHLDHWPELLQVEFLRRLLLRKHDGHRTRSNIDPLADVVQQHAVPPCDLRRLHTHDLLHGRVVERFVHAEHPRRDVRVAPARSGRSHRAQPTMFARPLGCRDLLRRT